MVSTELYVDEFVDRAERHQSSRSRPPSRARGRRRNASFRVATGAPSTRSSARTSNFAAASCALLSPSHAWSGPTSVMVPPPPTSDAAAIDFKTGASAGRMKPPATALSTDAFHALTKPAWVGYSVSSVVWSNATVVPNRKQKLIGPAAAVVLPVPRSVATGTSTCGERTPPVAFPFASEDQRAAPIRVRGRETRAAARRQSPVGDPLVQMEQRGLQRPVSGARVHAECAAARRSPGSGSATGLSIRVEEVRGRLRCRSRCRTARNRASRGRGARSRPPPTVGRSASRAGGSSACRSRSGRRTPGRRGRCGSGARVDTVPAGRAAPGAARSRPSRGCARGSRRIRGAGVESR